MPASLSMAPAFHIRQIRGDDLDRVLGYFAGLSERSRRSFHPHPFDVPHAERIVHTSAQPDCFRIAAVVGNGDHRRIAGYAFFEDGSEPGRPSVGIGVADEFQGQGIGKALMRALIGEARRRGKSGLRLDVYKENSAAQHLYAQAGFRICGETPDGKQHSMRLDFTDR